MEVSARLRAEPEVERNLNGYLITAFHHRVRSQLLRDSRLAYEGLLNELEENHQPRAPDWIKALGSVASAECWQESAAKVE
jgi:hypothetical protein